MNSNALLSTVPKSDKREGGSYYVRDIKSSLGEFKNNEEFMDAHLTHFMETISTFKMFTCSYLPQKPHKSVELKELAKDKITIVFDLDETLVHAQVMDWHLRAEDLGEGKVVNI